MKDNSADAKKELHEVKEQWLKRSLVSQSAHYDAGNSYERWFLTLGCIVVVCSAVIGGAEVLVSSEIITEIGPGNAKAASGVISLVIAILAGLQTFLKFSQKAEQHKVAGARYGEIRRSLEELNIVSAESIHDAEHVLHEIKKRMDSLALESPELPRAIVKKHGG
ncbi:MAG: SLATT domain-containing protein, partial [Motiliproteus sp.]